VDRKNKLVKSNKSDGMVGARRDRIAESEREK
jgi:hypothetical protein